MEQTFNFNTEYNTFNNDVGSIILNFDTREMEIFDAWGADLIKFYLNRNEVELKRLYKAIGNLLEEIKDD